MSFQAQTDEQLEQELKPEGISLSGFEKHLIQCLKLPEWILRKNLKKYLSRVGFEIYEDGYLSDRAKKDKRYSTVHNMLAIRGGDDANICLAAHTDICRDHAEMRDSHDQFGRYGEQQYWMYDGAEKISPRVPRKVEPVVKLVEVENQKRRIITDKENRLQVGGDDRLGVAIATWIALNTGYNMGLAFFTDEEIGCRSSSAWEMERLKAFDLVAQIDRGNHTDQLVNKISGEILCDYDTTIRLLSIAHKMGQPREVVVGASTDVAALKRKGMVKNAVNMTCGYMHSMGESPLEWIDMEDAVSTLHFCANIVKDYYCYGNTIK